MSFWKRIFGGDQVAHEGEEFFNPSPPVSGCIKLVVGGELVDPPKPSIRAETLRFAAIKYNGFTDEELIAFLDRPNAPRTTLLTPRLRLVRSGLIVNVGQITNARGNAVNLYRLAEYVGGVAREPVKPLTRAQLVRKLTTAALEISALKAKLAIYEGKAND